MNRREFFKGGSSKSPETKKNTGEEENTVNETPVTRREMLGLTTENQEKKTSDKESVVDPGPVIDRREFLGLERKEVDDTEQKKAA